MVTAGRWTDLRRLIGHSQAFILSQIRLFEIILVMINISMIDQSDNQCILFLNEPEGLNKLKASHF